MDPHRIARMLKCVGRRGDGYSLSLLRNPLTRRVCRRGRFHFASDARICRATAVVSAGSNFGCQGIAAPLYPGGQQFFMSEIVLLTA